MGLSIHKATSEGMKEQRNLLLLASIHTQTSLNADIRVSSSGLAIKTVRQLHVLCLKRGESIQAVKMWI